MLFSSGEIMKTSTLSIVFGLSLAALASSANALTTSVTSGPSSPASGVTTYDFGASSSTNDSSRVGYLGSVNYSTATFAGGELFNFSSSISGISGVAARPVNSTGNFWSIEAGQTGTVTFSAPISYYGFLWGSPDPLGWNTVTFYNGSNVLGAFSGVDIPSTNTWDKTVYFNVSSGNGPAITSIVFTANQNAFETDNHSFIVAVPEPETYAMLLAGLGLMGTIARRRKAAQA